MSYGYQINRVPRFGRQSQRGAASIAAASVVTVLFVSLYLVSWWWSREPGEFDVREVVAARLPAASAEPVVGVMFTATLIGVAETLLDKSGGYLSNDVMPPGVLLDNMPNWEFGALVMLRDASAILRNDFSRSQSQSVEDENLARAEPQFNFQNDSWILPTTEGQYREGIDELDTYLQRLSDPGEQQAQFYARADNLRKYLEVLEKRLGSLSQRLSASVGQQRFNTDLAGDADAKQSTEVPGSSTFKTPWLKTDDVFYEARGATWALRAILEAVSHDFAGVLEKKNAMVSLQQIIRELDATQERTLSPVLLNGGGFGIFSNYSLTMANYIARANAAVIDLRSLLEQG